MSTLGPHQHQPYTQGSEALTEWEAWNDMVTTHLEKQHNPTLHAIVRRSSSLTSMISERGGERAPENSMCAPHWLVQTESSAKKSHREVFSTPRSRAELFLAANSPPGVGDVSVIDSASSFSIERRRSSRSMMPPSASESLPHIPQPFNFLMASAPRKEAAPRVEHETALPSSDQSPLDRTSDQPPDVSTPTGDIITPVSGTPRSARLDAQRILRLRQEREERNRRDATSRAAPATNVASDGAYTGNDAERPDPQRKPTLDDIAQGALDNCVAAVVALEQQQTVAQEAPAPNDTHTTAAIEEDMKGHQVTCCAQPSESTSPSPPPVAPAIEEDTVLSSPDASTTSSDGVAPNSSEDVEAHFAVGVANELLTGATSCAPTSKKRAAMDQLPYRKKKELIEKARSRHFVLADEATASVAPVARNGNGSEGNASCPSHEQQVDTRHRGGARDGQTSNADADVSRGDDDAPQSTVKRSQREKKSSSGSRRRVPQTGNTREVPTTTDLGVPVLPPPDTPSDAEDAPPTSINPSAIPSTPTPSAEPTVSSPEQEACASFSVPTLESASIGAPSFSSLVAEPTSRRSIEHSPRPRRKSFGDDDDINDDDATDTATATTASTVSSSGDAAAAQHSSDSESDDLDAAVRSVIQERAMAASSPHEGSASHPQRSEERDGVGSTGGVALFCCQSKEQLSLALSARDSAMNEVSSTLEELEVTRAMLRNLETANRRLEQQQSLLLSALDRCALAADLAEEEEEARRVLLVSEQQLWDVSVEAAFVEDQVCLEALRYEQMADEGHTNAETTWREICEDLNIKIVDLQTRLTAAYEEHEADVGEREMEFESERSALALMHVEAIDTLTTRHADALSATQEHLWGLVESTKADLSASLAAAHAQHEETTATFHAAHLAALAAADSERRLQLLGTQRSGAHLADQLWGQLRNAHSLAAASHAFYVWKQATTMRSHCKALQSLSAEHCAAVELLRSDHERALADASDEYSKQQQQYQFVLSMSDSLQCHLDATTGALASLTNEHDALCGEYARLECESNAKSSENNDLCRRIASLEALLHKTKAIYDAQRQELFAQESLLQSQSLLRQQSERSAARLSLQRQALQEQLCALLERGRLAAWWQRWNRRVVGRLLFQGRAAHKQNDEAREELQRWREHLLSANSPRRSRCGQESQSSRTGSRGAQSANMSTSLRATSVASFGPNPHRTTSVASATTADVVGPTNLLDAEDDLTISLKYLLARERGELSAVKASLVKHRQMLGEGNEAMERMIMEMEILSKQNKELVKLCSKRGLDVPRALKSAEVPRIVQRMFVEEGASPPPQPPSASTPPSAPLPAHRFTRSEEDAEGGYVVD